MNQNAGIRNKLILWALCLCLALGAAFAVAEPAEPVTEAPVQAAEAITPAVTDAQAAAGFITQVMTGRKLTPPKPRGTVSGDQLTGREALLYEALKAKIQQAAAGQISDTRFQIPVKDVFENLAYASTSELNVDFQLVMRALLYDTPYDLYWYDKSYKNTETNQSAASYGGPSYSQRDGSYYIWEYETSCLTVSLCVSADYSESGNAGTYALDTSYGARAVTAAENARSVVEANQYKSDLHKLQAYKEYICDHVDYNHDAANDKNNTPYGDPWQLVSVFDGDDSTKVVCEGYSKAFQFLCDESNFRNGTNVVSVTGTMAGGTGAGAHMWNIVTLSDGCHYMADITNSDEGTVGADGGLFLDGYTSEILENNQYNYTAGGQTIAYVYDAITLQLLNETGILAMSKNAYALPAALEGGREVTWYTGLSSIQDVDLNDEPVYSLSSLGQIWLPEEVRDLDDYQSPVWSLTHVSGPDNFELAYTPDPDWVNSWRDGYFFAEAKPKSGSLTTGTSIYTMQCVYQGRTYEATLTIHTVDPSAVPTGVDLKVYEVDNANGGVLGEVSFDGNAVTVTTGRSYWLRGDFVGGMPAGTLENYWLNSDFHNGGAERGERWSYQSPDTVLGLYTSNTEHFLALEPGTYTAYATMTLEESNLEALRSFTLRVADENGNVPDPVDPVPDTPQMGSREVTWFTGLPENEGEGDRIYSTPAIGQTWLPESVRDYNDLNPVWSLIHQSGPDNFELVYAPDPGWVDEWIDGFFFAEAKPKTGITLTEGTDVYTMRCEYQGETYEGTLTIHTVALSAAPTGVSFQVYKTNAEGSAIGEELTFDTGAVTVTGGNDYYLRGSFAGSMPDNDPRHHWLNSDFHNGGAERGERWRNGDRDDLQIYSSNTEFFHATDPGVYTAYAMMTLENSNLEAVGSFTLRVADAEGNVPEPATEITPVNIPESIILGQDLTVSFICPGESGYVDVDIWSSDSERWFGNDGTGYEGSDPQELTLYAEQMIGNGMTPGSYLIRIECSYNDYTASDIKEYPLTVTGEVPVAPTLVAPVTAEAGSTILLTGSAGSADTLTLSWYDDGFQDETFPADADGSWSCQVPVNRAQVYEFVLEGRTSEGLYTGTATASVYASDDSSLPAPIFGTPETEEQHYALDVFPAQAPDGETEVRWYYTVSLRDEGTLVQSYEYSEETDGRFHLEDWLNYADEVTVTAMYRLDDEYSRPGSVTFTVPGRPYPVNGPIKYELNLPQTLPSGTDLVIDWEPVADGMALHLDVFATNESGDHLGWITSASAYEGERIIIDGWRLYQGLYELSFYADAETYEPTPKKMILEVTANPDRPAAPVITLNPAEPTNAYRITFIADQEYDELVVELRQVYGDYMTEPKETITASHTDRVASQETLTPGDWTANVYAKLGDTWCKTRAVPFSVEEAAFVGPIELAEDLPEITMFQPFSVTLKPSEHATRYSVALLYVTGSDDTGTYSDTAVEAFLELDAPATAPVTLTLENWNGNAQLDDCWLWIEAGADGYVASTRAFYNLTVHEGEIVPIISTNHNGFSREFIIGMDYETYTIYPDRVQTDPQLDYFYLDNEDALRAAAGDQTAPVWTVTRKQGTAGFGYEGTERGLDLSVTSLPQAPETDLFEISVVWGRAIWTGTYTVHFVNSPNGLPTGIETDLPNPLVLKAGDSMEIGDRAWFINHWHATTNGTTGSHAGLEGEAWDASESDEYGLRYAAHPGSYVHASIVVESDNVKWLEEISLYVTKEDGTLNAADFTAPEGAIVWKLPAGTKRIESEAFAGVPVAIADIPATVEFIAADAFADTNLFAVYTHGNPVTIAFAQEHGLIAVEP